MARHQTRRKKILHVTPHIYPNVLGGIGLSTHELAIALSTEFDVTVASTWLGHRPPTGPSLYRLIAFETDRVVYGNPVSAPMLLWVSLHAADFDLIHVHSHLFGISAHAVFMARAASRPTVLTNHGLVSHSFSLEAQEVWSRFALKTVFRHCNRLICYTDADANRYRDLGATTDHIAVIPYGIDAARFVGVDRSSTDHLRLVWLGRMVPEKGLPLLLNALALDGDLRDNIRLTLIGDGPELNGLRQQVRELGLSGTVQFMHSVDNESVPGILQAHDALILPSLTEGLPRTALEAFATEMPVLCTGLPQLTECFGDAAMYFDPRDPLSIRDAILAAVQDREGLKRLGRAGRRLVEENYSLDSAAARIGRLYEDAMAAGA